MNTEEREFSKSTATTLLQRAAVASAGNPWFLRKTPDGDSIWVVSKTQEGPTVCRITGAGYGAEIDAEFISAAYPNMVSALTRGYLKMLDSLATLANSPHDHALSVHACHACAAQQTLDRLPPLPEIFT